MATSQSGHSMQRKSGLWLRDYMHIGQQHVRIQWEKTNLSQRADDQTSMQLVNIDAFLK